jgi:ArsR family metal-binding transcriptional regulator
MQSLVDKEGEQAMELFISVLTFHESIAEVLGDDGVIPMDSETKVIEAESIKEEVEKAIAKSSDSGASAAESNEDVPDVENYDGFVLK